jgi:hypothetical protein
MSVGCSTNVISSLPLGTILGLQTGILDYSVHLILYGPKKS